MALIPMMLIASWVCAQDRQALSEKKGTFELLSRNNYTMPALGFTLTEVNNNLQKITEIVNTVQKNPVLYDIKGFNGRARIYTVSIIEKEIYGVPSRISFEFSSFFYNREGKVTFNSIEPPEWSLYLNDMVPGWSDSFNTKHGYFTVPLNKKTIEPGIDLYDDERFVIYDPSRPPYWIAVTVREAFEAAREEINAEKDPVAAKYLKEVFEQEYSEISPADLDKQAYFGGNLSRISTSSGYEGQDSIFPLIMKVNPEYWNRSRPRSDVQFIYFKSVRDKEYLKRRLDECQKNINSGSGCDLQRFELSFGMTDILNLKSKVTK